MARSPAPPWDPTPSCRIAVGNFTFTECEELPRDVFPLEFSHLNGPDLFRVDSLLVMHDTVFRDVGGDFLRFRQRSDPLVIIELLRGWVLFFHQEHEGRVEEESTFFW